MGSSIILFALLGVLLLAYVFLPWHQHVPSRLLKWAARMKRRAQRLINEFAVIAMIKIVTSFYQVLLMVHDIYDVPFPRLYLEFLMKYFGWFQFEFVKFARVECVRKINFYEVVLTTSGAMLLLQFTSLLSYAFFPKCLGLGRYVKGQYMPRRVLPRRIGAACLVLAYFIYSPVSANVFQVFNCRSINGGRYLRKDYSLDCTTREHIAMEVFSVFMVLFTCIGLPMQYFVVLYVHRNHLGKLRALSFFLRDYSPRWRYWEIVECFKRVFLAGAAVFLEQGSLAQLGASAFVVAVYLILLQAWRPYRQRNHFAFFANLALFCALFLAVFVKVKSGWTSKGVYEDGISLEFLTALLIVCSIGVFIVFVVELIRGMLWAVPQAYAENKRVRMLKIISARFAELPRADPIGLAFYDLKTPVTGTDKDKMLALKLLRKGNKARLEDFFQQLHERCGLRRVGDHKDCFQQLFQQRGAATDLVNPYKRVKSGFVMIKTDASTLAKATRPSILQEYPHYGLEHVRDFLRFKVVCDSFYDGFVFLHELATCDHFRAVKVDLNKLLQPKEWGWRFIGADIQASNGQLIECYVVFKAMDTAKKYALFPDLHQESNHDIYEEWRAFNVEEMAESEREQMLCDASISRRVYNRAFFETIRQTTFDEWMAAFSEFASPEQLSHAKALYVEMIHHHGDYDHENEDKDRDVRTMVAHVASFASNKLSSFHRTASTFGLQNPMFSNASSFRAGKQLGGFLSSFTLFAGAGSGAAAGSARDRTDTISGDDMDGLRQVRGDSIESIGDGGGNDGDELQLQQNPMFSKQLQFRIRVDHGAQEEEDHGASTMSLSGNQQGTI
eukprot:g569.t1